MSGTLSHKLRFHLDEAAALHNKALNLPRPKRDSNNQHRIRSPSAYQVSANLEKGGEEKKDLHCPAAAMWGVRKTEKVTHSSFQQVHCSGPLSN